jgi:hypothetical protein
MPANALGLRADLVSLQPGQSAIVGPLANPRAVSTKISHARERSGEPGREYTQRQLLLVDPRSCEAWHVYLVTRLR